MFKDTNTIATPWVVKNRLRPEAKMKLFCLPFAGGNVTAYRDWGDILPTSIELCAVEIPGRGQRMMEPLITNLPELVDQIAKGILKELDKPFIIFGHSMGAVTGYELVHHLKQKYNLQPVHLFVSGRGAPHLPEREDPIHKLPKNEFIEKIKSYNGTPKEVLAHQELMDLVEPIIRADFSVCETYSHITKSPLEIPISAFGGLADSDVSKTDLEQWQQHTAKQFTCRMFPGGHFYLQQQHVTLLQAILQDLNTHWPIN